LSSAPKTETMSRIVFQLTVTDRRLIWQEPSNFDTN